MDTTVRQLDQEQSTIASLSNLYVCSPEGSQIRRNSAIDICLADTASRFESASVLVNRMYSWRGYGNDHILLPDRNRITLTASEEGTVVGTMSVGIDSHDIELAADHLFRAELDACRRDGARLCELTKLAVDPLARSKFTLAHLFHFALVFARDMHGCTDAIMEVNPRHRGFYQRMIGFRQLCEVRTNVSVNAPACLMHIKIAHVSEQVLRHGGSATEHGANGSHPMYGCFYGSAQEITILASLKLAAGLS